MTGEDIFNRIREFFMEEFEIPGEEIRPEADMFADLGLDSIDALDMVGMLESEANIEVVEEELKEIRTIQDVIDYTLRKLSGKNTP